MTAKPAGSLPTASQTQQPPHADCPACATLPLPVQRWRRPLPDIPGTIELQSRPMQDELVVEEPLEVFLDGEPYAVMLRMPGEDLHLALGHLVCEGLLRSADELAEALLEPEPNGAARLWLRLAPRPHRSSQSRGAGPGSLRLSLSSSGSAGARSLKEIMRPMAMLPHSVRVDASDLFRFREEAEGRQHVFDRTGATHCCALYGLDHATGDKGWAISAYAEDVGRHNALDKAAGQALLAGTLGRTPIAVLSSRLSYEMVHKAAVLGVEVLAGFSAATSCAAGLAEKLGMTLVGYLRPGRMTVYTHPDRLIANPR